MNLRFDIGSQMDIGVKHIAGAFENVYTELESRRDEYTEVIIPCSNE